MADVNALATASLPHDPGSRAQPPGSAGVSGAAPPRRVARLALALVLMLVSASLVEPVPITAAKSRPSPTQMSDAAADNTDPRAACRSWTNEWQPPRSIRVYRTRGPATGKVQTVNFRRYVAVVMAGEWPSSMPRETLRAGALAVKQYAWYYSLFYRGWLAPDGTCFHVMDTSMDQVYYPEMRVPHRRHVEAMTATWPVSLRRPRPNTGRSRLILTSYRLGRSVPCGTDSDGLKLFQRSARACGWWGMTYKQILRTYYGAGLEFVDVRPHDILADPAWRGDAAVLTGAAGSGKAEWRVYAARATGFRAAVSGSFALELGNLLDVGAADVTGNGLSDLVLLVRSGKKGRRLVVLRTTGVGYRRAQLWASWREQSAKDGRRLLLADFTGDGLADAGVLRAIQDPTSSFARATLRVMPALPAGGFGTAVRWWRGGFDPAINVALAGDVTGNGRADLIVRQDRASRGLRYWVMRSRPTGGGLRAPRLWLERRDWRASTTMQVLIDENRDGRDDLFVIRPAGTAAISIFALRSRPAGGFAVSLRWRTPSGRSMPFSGLRPVALHVDGDGRGDLAFFERRSNRTRLFWLRTTDVGMELGQALVDSTLGWSRARPY